MQLTSTPNIDSFVPLPSQLEVIKHIRKKSDYSKGTHEILLSGSVGSAKSLTLAHLVVTHCMMFPGARVGIGRLALPQLKATLCNKIREHIYGCGIDYKYHETTGNFELLGSEIRAISWADNNMAKLGSMEFSAFAIEELTETKDSRPYDTILQRVNRLPHIREPWVVSGTNPDGPDHWAYKKIIMSDSPKVKVFYSNTYENPYLDPSYIETLKERLDERMAQRMIYGKWIALSTDVVYYAYSKDNYVDADYVIDKRYPVRLMYDFNIGEGKPLSLVFGQYINDKDQWHFFNEVIVDGQRTLDSLEESAARGLIDINCFYIVNGDATGRSRDTRSIRSDYDIIENYLSNYSVNGKRLQYRVDVPRANPPIRERHNVLNGYCKNSKGHVKLFVYRGAKTVDEGLRLTKLRSSGSYLEEDSDRFQHCTTSIGYGIMVEYYKRSMPSKSMSQGRY